jgi:hypothetical protein
MAAPEAPAKPRVRTRVRSLQPAAVPAKAPPPAATRISDNQPTAVPQPRPRPVLVPDATPPAGVKPAPAATTGPNKATKLSPNAPEHTAQPRPRPVLVSPPEPEATQAPAAAKAAALASKFDKMVITNTAEARQTLPRPVLVPTAGPKVKTGSKIKTRVKTGANSDEPRGGGAPIILDSDKRRNLRESEK